jgi:hypothetical protein
MMAWTDSETVKAHLPGLDTPDAVVQDEAVRFDALGVAQLSRRGIKNGSEVVKRLATTNPVGPEEVTLPAETWIALPDSPLLPGQSVVSDGWPLGTIYAEGRDFLIDESPGKIRRVAGGSIGDGATVTTWYQTYEALTKDVDYVIDYALGTISIQTGSDLEPGSSIWVDYEQDALASVDGLIDSAITEAEDKIVRRLKSDYSSSSTDQGLVTGATELTLSIVCRSLAVRALSDKAPGAEARAKAWILLAQQFEQTASFTLRSFLASPAITSGKRESNGSWEWV